MTEKSMMNEDRLANEVLAEATQPKTKKLFVEPRLVKYETLIENTLGGAVGVLGAVALS